MGLLENSSEPVGLRFCRPEKLQFMEHTLKRKALDTCEKDTLQNSETKQMDCKYNNMLSAQRKKAIKTWKVFIIMESK